MIKVKLLFLKKVRKINYGKGGNIMKYISQEHKKFCNECLQHSKRQDCYHQALFYTLGVCSDTRRHINDIFDFKSDGIKLDALEKDWQTSGSEKVCLMAFNMWNGFDKEKETTPSNLFNYEYSPYFFEATKLRFEHTSLNKPNQEKGNVR